MTKKTSVVFFGTGPVAAKSLELLINNFKIEAVITKPKPIHHKGEFPVLEIAKKYNLPLVEVTDKNSTSESVKEQNFSSKLAILIDFGIIIAQDVIDSFEKGIVNSHFSLLPEWRGADPITFSILSGQKQTGVSLMLVVEKMDEGPLLAVGIEELSGLETTPELTDRLIYLSDALLEKELPRYLAGETSGIEQNKMNELIPNYPIKPSYSRKLSKNDGLIDWGKPAEVIEREIRAFQGWPKSKTTLNGFDLIITKTQIVNENGKAGEYRAGKSDLLVFTADKAISIDEIKPAGKQAMSIAAFLAGYRDRL